MNQAGDQPLAGGVRRWQFLAGMMKEMGFQTLVEVGCKEGRVSAHILEEIPDASVVAIDPWMPQAKGDDPDRETYDDWDFTQIKNQFWKNVGEHESRVTMMRETSLEAAAKIPDESVEVVFIDAMHDYGSVRSDIAAWWPKIKPGGVLAGHDYNHKWVGVERAVSDSFDLMQVGLGPDSIWFVVKTDGTRFNQVQ